jgi:predicted PolB exonuclease-like 3'-5' exonuclease
MELFHFDIETRGSYKDYQSFKKNDERGAELFESKYFKYEWDGKYANLDEAYLANAGIISTYGSICCISFGFLDNGNKRISSYYGEDEKQIVTQFNDLLKKIEKKNFTLSGFRIVHFDIPWILHKLHKYGIEPANIIYLYDKKPWECRIVDIAEDWKGKFAWSPTFDEVCYELNVKSPKDVMNGSEVHKYYWEGKYEDIKTYCEKDVSSSIDVGEIIYK